MKRYGLHKKSNLIALISFIILVVIWLIYMVWWLFPYKTLEVGQPYQVISDEVKQGGLLQYEIDYCKYTNKVATVRRQFVDGIIYAIPEVSANLPKGCDTEINSVKIPEELPVGTYTLEIVVEYQVNPIRVITHNLKTTPFKVVK